jgi:cytochrome b
MSKYANTITHPGRPVTRDATSMVRVWDPLVRIAHWTLLAGFFIAYFSEDDFLTVHVWAGYSVAIIVVLRVVWGFIGTAHARFSDFVCSPRETLAYLAALAHGRARRYLGHNPAGATMVLALLLSLAGTTVAGSMLYAIEEDAGPLAGWVADAGSVAPAGLSIELPSLISTARADDDDDEDRRSNTAGRGESKDHEAREEFWEEVHELFANITLLLVGIHILGVLYSSHLHKENLPLAMITGRKRAE